MAGSAGANAMQGMQELFRTPLQRVFRRPDRRFAMREGCSAPERTDAFLDLSCIFISDMQCPKINDRA